MVEYLTLEDIKIIAEKKLGKDLKWNHTSGLYNNFLFLTDYDEVIVHTDCNDEFEIYIESEKGMLYPYVVIWESEILDTPVGKGLLTRGALNGILVINNETVTTDDIDLLNY